MASNEPADLNTMQFIFRLVKRRYNGLLGLAGILIVFGLSLNIANSGKSTGFEETKGFPFTYHTWTDYGEYTQSLKIFIVDHCLLAMFPLLISYLCFRLKLLSPIKFSLGTLVISLIMLNIWAMIGFWYYKYYNVIGFPFYAPLPKGQLFIMSGCVNCVLVDLGLYFLAVWVVNQYIDRCILGAFAAVATPPLVKAELPSSASPPSTPPNTQPEKGEKPQSP
jgi:hypothetical protein